MDHIEAQYLTFSTGLIRVEDALVLSDVPCELLSCVILVAYCSGYRHASPETLKEQLYSSEDCQKL